MINYPGHINFIVFLKKKNIIEKMQERENTPRPFSFLSVNAGLTQASVWGGSHLLYSIASTYTEASTCCKPISVPSTTDQTHPKSRTMPLTGSMLNRGDHRCSAYKKGKGKCLSPARIYAELVLQSAAEITNNLGPVQAPLYTALQSKHPQC